MKNYIKILVIFGFLVVSCKKDKTPFPFEPPYNDLEYGWMDEPTESDYIAPNNPFPYFVLHKKQYSSPHFNPSDPNEIVYYYTNSEDNTRQLIKYNLISTEKLVLTSGITVVSEISWSSSGWIAFYSQPSHQLFLIRDDGTGLVQITENDVNRWPRWSADGNYLYWGNTSLINQNTIWLRRNFLTENIDTIHHGQSDPNSFSVINAKISLDNQLLSAKNINTNWYFVHADLNTIPLNIIPILEISQLPYGETFQCWSHNSQYFFVSYYGTGLIFKIRISDGSFIQIRDEYYANWIETIHASPDGKYIVAERVEMSNTFHPITGDPMETQLQTKIQLIDLETKKIKILDLD